MLSYLESVMRAKSVEEVWAQHTAKMLTYGFDRLIYGFTRYKTANSFGNIQDVLLLSNQSPEYLEGFVNGGLYHHAPMVRWARENVGSCSWSWMEENLESFSQSELNVLEFNRKMGVTAGYSLSFPGRSSRSKGGIALTARRGVVQGEVDAVWEEHGREIWVMNQVAHLTMISLPQAKATRALTSRQREALQWVGDGKTTQDIALLMGLTPATIEKHLRLSRDALDAETTAQAVLKASVINQMYVIEA